MLSGTVALNTDAQTTLLNEKRKCRKVYLICLHDIFIFTF